VQQDIGTLWRLEMVWRARHAELIEAARRRVPAALSPTPTPAPPPVTEIDLTEPETETLIPGPTDTGPLTTQR